MYLKTIHIKNYRLLADIKIDLDSATTIIVGRNNTGKTSLMNVEYELTKAEIVAPQYIIPLIREICAASSGGGKVSETSIRIKAYEIISILQLIFFRAKDISNYLGFDVLDYDRMVEVIDTILNDHFPDHLLVRQFG